METLRRHVLVTEDELVADEQRKAKRRAMKGKRNTEADEQAQFVTWARARGLTLWHTPNENASVRRAMKLRKLGQLAGVADAIIANRLPMSPEARGLAIEFKSASGQLRPAQAEWSLLVGSCGWHYRVARSCAEAKQICLDYGL